MAQKEWKREEMKQNQGRTEQNQRKKVQKKTGYRAVLAASMFLIAASAALSACQKSPAAETTAQTQAAEETEGAVSTALGAADRVLEENGMLYLKYRTEIRSLSKETGEMKTAPSGSTEAGCILTGYRRRVAAHRARSFMGCTGWIWRAVWKSI